MRNIKRILAWIGICLIAFLFITTLVLAIAGNENTFRLFVASLVALICVPVMIWAYTFIYDLLKKNYGPDSVSSVIPESDPEDPANATGSSDHTSQGTSPAEHSESDGSNRAD